MQRAAVSRRHRASCASADVMLWVQGPPRTKNIHGRPERSSTSVVRPDWPFRKKYKRPGSRTRPVEKKKNKGVGSRIPPDARLWSRLGFWRCAAIFHVAANAKRVESGLDWARRGLSRPPPSPPRRSSSARREERIKVENVLSRAMVRGSQRVEGGRGWEVVLLFLACHLRCHTNCPVGMPVD